MSGKKEGLKLGRNPFERKRPSYRNRHERSGAPAKKENRKIQSSIFPGDLPSPPISREPPGKPVFPTNPAWLFIDLWAGFLMEPYFFWASSLSRIKEDMR